jgi:hypothetical protein
MITVLVMMGLDAGERERVSLRSQKSSHISSRKEIMSAFCLLILPCMLVMVDC